MPVSSIADRQNTPDVLTLARAMTAAHARVQRLEGGRIIMSVLVALTSTAAVLVPTLTAPVATLGAGWALLQGLGFTVWTQRALSRAAAAQELFDVTLFGIEWNTAAAGSRPPPAEISDLARRFRGPEHLVRDYYEVRGVVDDLPWPLDVLACQMQNLHWGARIRRRFAAAVLALLISWPLAGILAGTLLQMPIGQLLVIWFVPALGMLLTASDLYRRQAETSATRSRVLALVTDRFREQRDRPAATADLTVLARQVQDVLLATRRTQARVPDWFFLHFRPRDRVDFQREVADLGRSAPKRPSSP
ncbi:S-4TM family putative pore-forming effector [Actinoplanes sp. NBRC 101535]|uniref:S-4TM family putative pore-forming effector n=1 Tax=Actinoplanes sp. NBRC 101535 TaxID=3032196 RepID=UPI0024A052E2|nr:S-4TM family putative pore-forming effector [Actinoplanes sp. NBRC 101535]GLY03881.1 hypothetical protein Acsp01_42600 [Actinoplanes sp. NBRC 101535]